MGGVTFNMSNNYFIGSDGELYHWGWKKKDAKYIKREWKNGKWQYTYPYDPVDNSAAKKHAEKKAVQEKNLADFNKAFAKSKNFYTRGNDGRGIGSRKASKEYEAELAYNSKKNSNSSAASDNTASKVSSGKNAIATGSKVSSEYLAELAYNSQKNSFNTEKDRKPISTSSTGANSGGGDADNVKRYNLLKYATENSKDAIGRGKDYISSLMRNANAGGDGYAEAKEKLDKAWTERLPYATDYHKASTRWNEFREYLGKKSNGANSGSGQDTDGELNRLKTAADKALEALTGPTSKFGRVEREFEENYGHVTKAVEEREKKKQTSLDAMVDAVKQALNDTKERERVKKELDAAQKKADNALKKYKAAEALANKTSKEEWDWINSLRTTPAGLALNYNDREKRDLEKKRSKAEDMRDKAKAALDAANKELTRVRNRYNTSDAAAKNAEKRAEELEKNYQKAYDDYQDTYAAYLRKRQRGIH